MKLLKQLHESSKEGQSAYDHGVKDAVAGRPAKNASDVYGPFSGRYDTGYADGKKKKLNEARLSSKQSFKQKELEQELANEIDQPRPHARWIKDAGPEGIGGFDLQQEDENGWSSIGFIKTSDKPKTNSLVVKMYDGTKMIKVDLDAYDFFS